METDGGGYLRISTDIISGKVVRNHASMAAEGQKDR